MLWRWFNQSNLVLNSCTRRDRANIRMNSYLTSLTAIWCHVRTQPSILNATLYTTYALTTWSWMFAIIYWRFLIRTWLGHCHITSFKHRSMSTPAIKRASKCSRNHCAWASDVSKVRYLTDLPTHQPCSNYTCTQWIFMTAKRPPKWCARAWSCRSLKCWRRSKTWPLSRQSTLSFSRSTFTARTCNNFKLHVLSRARLDVWPWNFILTCQSVVPSTFFIDTFILQPC